MEKLYTYEEYTLLADEAKNEGKIVYKVREMVDVLDDEGQPTGEKIAISESIEKQYRGYYITIEENITDGTLNPNFEEEQAAKERQRLDALTLTPADVERALYKAKGMDFEDLKALIATQAPQIDMKALAIEFRANLFYRGVVVNGIRLIDTVGALLGYTADDMDYLFINKELPNEELN